MNLTCKNRGFYYNSGGRIKSWNFRSAPNVLIHILKIPVNSYDSNSVIAVPISTLGDKKRNLPFFCLPIIPLESPQHIGSYYTSLEIYFQGEHNTIGIVRNGSELTEIFETSFMNLNLRRGMKSGPLIKPSGSLCGDEQLLWRSQKLL